MKALFPVELERVRARLQMRWSLCVVESWITFKKINESTATM